MPLHSFFYGGDGDGLGGVPKRKLYRLLELDF